MAKEKAAEKETTIWLKVNPMHPKREFRIGRHLVRTDAGAFTLNEAELAELNTPGPQKWVIQTEAPTKKTNSETPPADTAGADGKGSAPKAQGRAGSKEK